MEVNSTLYGLEIRAKELDFYNIIDFLRSKNIKILGIQMQEPTLDDVFLQLTGKEVNL